MILTPSLRWLWFRARRLLLVFSTRALVRTQLWFKTPGPTVTGNSAVALLDATGTTKTLPIRIVDVVQDTSYVSGGNVLFPEVIVKINAPSMDGDGVSSGGHMYNNPLGL
jgi:hypothetical protein